MTAHIHFASTYCAHTTPEKRPTKCTQGPHLSLTRTDFLPLEETISPLQVFPSMSCYPSPLLTTRDSTPPTQGTPQSPDKVMRPSILLGITPDASWSLPGWVSRCITLFSTEGVDLCRLCVASKIVLALLQFSVPIARHTSERACGSLCESSSVTKCLELYGL